MEIVEVKVKFKSFLNFYSMRPDAWRLFEDHVLKFDLDWLDKKVAEDPNSGMYITTSTDHPYQDEYAGWLRFPCVSHKYYIMGHPHISHHFPPTWKCTFSWIDRIRYKLWRKRQDKQDGQIKQNKIETEFLQSVQQDIDFANRKADRIIEEAIERLHRLTKADEEIMLEAKGVVENGT